MKYLGFKREIKNQKKKPGNRSWLPPKMQGNLPFFSLQLPFIERLCVRARPYLEPCPVRFCESCTCSTTN